MKLGVADDFDEVYELYVQLGGKMRAWNIAAVNERHLV
jgi:hypothetical protein